MGLALQALTKLTHPFEIWVKGETGDDNHAGTTEATAKKTLSAAMNTCRAHILSANFILHLQESFPTSEANQLTFSKYIDDENFFIIDGGNEVTTLEGPITADIHATKSLGDSEGSWTPDEFQGKWIKVTSGPCNGQIRRVLENSETTFQASRKFSEDPGECTFIICEPATTIGDGLGATDLTWRIYTGGGGTVKVQRITCDDPNFQLELGSAAEAQQYWIPQGYIDLSGIMINDSKEKAITGQHICKLSLSSQLIDLATCLPISEDVFSSGVSSMGAGELDFSYGSFQMENSDFKKLTLDWVGIWNIGKCVRLRNITLLSMTSIVDEEGITMWTTDDYNHSYIEDSDAAGLSMRCAFCVVKPSSESNFYFRNNATYGIHCKENSFIGLHGPVGGAGNGAGGCCVQNIANCQIKHGSPPTLTGNSVELTFDGTTQKSTWQNVDDGNRQTENVWLALCEETSEY